MCPRVIWLFLVADICLVHLVRASNGPKPFLDFFEAYSQNPRGIDHDVLFLFKGFTRATLPDRFLQVIESLHGKSLFISDTGFDIQPYGLALKMFTQPYFCFLNSFSRPLAEGWLEMLNRHIRLPGVG